MEMDDLFILGADYKSLHDSGTGNIVKGETNRAWVLTRFENRVNKMEISHYKVSDCIKKWKKRFGKYKKGQGLTTEDANEIRDDFFVLWDSIVAELEKRAILSEATEGLISRSRLRESLKAFLDASVINNLPSIAINDLNDAIICLRVGAYTAATMVILRAVESVLRIYYEFKTRKKVKVKSGFRGWNEILDELIKLPRVDKVLVGYFDLVRRYRNEAEHPEKNFSQKEAEETLLEATRLLPRMLKEIHKRK